MTIRTVEIYNGYELYDDVTLQKEIDLPDMEADETIEEYLDRIDGDVSELLFVHTGVGHEDGNSYYEMTTVDGLDPSFTRSWGG